jgi:hypothetical protein
LPPHDEGTLIFCIHCGAPQVLLSEELLTQVETQSKADAGGTNVGPVPRDSRSLVWAGAIRCAALAGAIAAGLACLSALLPSVTLLTILWTIISPVVVLGLFQARFPLMPITTGFGARMGVLTGLFVATALSVVATAMLLVARFGIHTMGEFDKQWASSLDQLQTRMLSQYGNDVLPLMKMYSLPEFRAGMMLSGIAFGVAILFAITTAGGAFAGFARSRPRV